MVEDNFFNNSQKVFKLFRIWSYHKGVNKNLLARFFKWMVFISTSFSMVVVTLSDAIEQLQQGEVAATLSKALFFLAMSVCAHKMFSTIFSEDEIFACIKQSERVSSRFKNTLDIVQSLRLYNKLFVIGVCSISLCAVSFMLAPLRTEEYRPLPLPSHLPYLNVVKTPNWQLFYVYECFAVFLSTTTMMAYDTLFCGMMCLCSGIVSSIRREIREFENIIEDHPALENKMIEIIVKLNEINQLTTKISDAFSVTTMTHIINICGSIALGLLMITGLPFDLEFISMIMLIVSVTFQLWIYCYFGQNLVSQKEVLRRDLYFTTWYGTSKNFKTMLLLTIFEAQNDRYVYAGKVLPLSLETFTKVIVKAYAFFTFINDSR